MNNVIFHNTAFYGESCQVMHINETRSNDFGPQEATNLLITAEIANFNSEIQSKGLGLKYVLGGEETYFSQKKEYKITPGKYLLVNESIPSVEGIINKTLTSSVCINIEPGLFNDVLNQVIEPDKIEDRNNVSNFMLSPDLLVRVNSAEVSFQEALKRVFFYNLNRKSPPNSMDMEMIYDITGRLLLDNIDLIKSCYGLKTAKSSTRKELFRRLLLGKEVLESNLFNSISIPEISAACFLSEYRFYRLFKQCFGTSPYNYFLQRRIDKSIELRKNGVPWEEIIFLLKFNDKSAFNKIFKNFKGVPPSKYPDVKL